MANGTQIETLTTRGRSAVMNPMAGGPGGTPPGPPSQQAGKDPSGGIWGMILRRKWLIVLGVIVGLGFGYLQYSRIKPVYQSSAQLLLVTSQTEAPVQGVQSQQQLDLNTQTYLIRSPSVISKAVEIGELERLPSFANKAHAMGSIGGGLAVYQIRNTSMLNLSYTGANPQDCQKVLQAVMQAYDEFLIETYRNNTQESIDLFNRVRKELDNQLSETRNEYEKFRKDTPLLWTDDKGVNIHIARLQNIEQARSRILVEQAQLKSQIDAINRALEKGETGRQRALQYLVDKTGRIDHNNPNNRLAQIERTMFPLLLEEQMLLQTYDIGHPKVKEVQLRIKVMSEHLRKHTMGETETDTKKPFDFLKIYVDSLIQELEINGEKLKGLNEQFTNESKAASAMSQDQLKDENYRAKIDRQEEMSNGIMSRLAEIDLIKDHGGLRTRVTMPPGVGYQTEPKWSKIMTMAGILGCLGGLGLAYLVDSADRSFRTPEEIRQSLGLPIIGHIPVIFTRRENPETGEDDPISKLHKILISYHRPKSQAAEAYRAVRTWLYFSVGAENHQVIQVTSPNPGDGKSTLAANLAISVAKSGKKVILIDTDFRRPEVNKLFGCGRENGMTDIIQNKRSIEECKRDVGIENLHVIPSGPKSEQSAELLTSPRFDEVLATLRQDYDFVVVDSPPVLAVSDPCVVAPRVDGVILTIRITSQSRDASNRAIDALTSLDIRLLGIVVNGVGGVIEYGDYEESRRYGYAFSSRNYRYLHGTREQPYRYYYEEDRKGPGNNNPS